MWLSSEYCLGRVGSMKWSSFVTAVCILLMATAIHASVFFIVLALLSLFCIGKRKAFSMGVTHGVTRPSRAVVADRFSCLQSNLCILSHELHPIE